MTGGTVLMFAEDPGAFAYLEGVEAALRQEGFDVVSAPPTSDDADGVIDRAQPAAVLVGTSENLDSFAFGLTERAKARRIPTFGAVDSAANAAFRFRGRSAEAFAHAPDHLLVPDAATRGAFVAHGFAPEAITVTGHPRLAEIARLRAHMNEEDRRAARARHFPAAGKRPVIVFVSELSTGLGDDPFRRTDAYTLDGTSGSDARTEIVAEEMLRAARALPSDPWLVLRLHPKQDPDDIARLAAGFDQVSRGGPGLEAVAGADLVTGMTSVLLAEAAVLGLPVLAIVPDPAERAWLGDMAGSIACVASRPDLEEALAKWPAPLPPQPEGGDPAARMAAAIRAEIERAR